MIKSSRKQIFSEDFESEQKAIDKMNTFNYGVCEKSDSVISTLYFTDEGQYSPEKIISYNSENEEAFYEYTIEKHKNFYRLCINRTYKHFMILAAKSGDLELFIGYFSNTEKMKDFALSEAINFNHWNIIKYLIDNYELKEKPAKFAIRYNKVEILEKLMDQGCILPEDWLAYCIYNDSLEVTKYLMIQKEKHLEYQKEDLTTQWYQSVINKQSETAKLVRQILS